MELQNWIKKLVIEFRNQYDLLSPDEQKRNISRLDDFSLPCQINTIWCQFHDINLQIIIVTKWEDREDLEINVYGPIESKDIIKKLENILEEEKWNRSFDKDERYSLAKGKNKYSTILKGIFINSFTNYKRDISLKAFKGYKEKPFVPNKGYFAKDAFYWICQGKMQDSDITQIINEIFKDIKKNKKTLIRKITKKENRIKGYGAYFFPPIWIEDEPEISLEDVITERPLTDYYTKSAYQTKLNNRILLFHKDGLIIIGDEDKNEALKYLNLVLSIACLYNYPSFVITENELGELDINLDNLKINGPTMSLASIRNLAYQERYYKYSSLPIVNPYIREIMPLKTLKSIIDLSNKFIANSKEKIINYLRNFLEGYTLFCNAEYSQSFIINWVILEKRIIQLRDRLIDGKNNIDNYRRKKLKDPNYWNSDNIIEVLNFTECIDDFEYEKYMKSKKIRNSVAHHGILVTEEQAKDCLIFSYNILNKMLDEECQSILASLREHLSEHISLASTGESIIIYEN